MEKVCLEDNSIPSLPRRKNVVEKNIFPFSHLFQTSATFKVKLLVQLLWIGFKSGLGGWGPIREKLNSIHFQHWHCNWHLHSLSDQETWNAAAASFFYILLDKTFHLLYFVWGDPLLYWRTLKSNWKTFLAAQTNILLFVQVLQIRSKSCGITSWPAALAQCQRRDWIMSDGPSFATNHYSDINQLHHKRN